MEPTLEMLKYPIGKFTYPEDMTPEDIANAIKTIEELPVQLRKEVEHLSDSQLDTSYRENGWTIRQVVHHLPDSHLNAYIRFKLALTEDNPTIKPYHEDRWAELPEAKTADINISLDLIDALHRRWVLMLRNMSDEDFKKTFFHPENKKSRSLKEILALYEWHCRHHLAHITELKKRKGWKWR